MGDRLCFANHLRAQMPTRASDAADYGEHRRQSAERSRERSRDGRDIGPLPAVADPQRKLRGLMDAEFFNRTYFPARFELPFGEPHRLAMRTMALCSEEGGQFAFAMARGSGKTTLAECEVIRALVYGLRRYIAFIAATDGMAAVCVESILRELETNDALYADFPEVCHPIRSLERVNQRAKGQTLDGLSTYLELSGGHLVLPTVPNSPGSGGLVQGYGLTGAIRGLKHLTPDGTILRPDLVVIDDAQTRDSAKSPMQTDDRERTILADVLGLAGPRTKMAAVFLCTPIFPNDLTERFISRERHPDWQGVRTRMVERMPSRMDLWDEYSEVRRESLRAGDGGKRATEFYRANRAAMDGGCTLSWPERVKSGDLSGVQSALNLYYAAPTAFASEYQCEPEASRLAAGAKELDAREVAARGSGAARGAVPPGGTRVTVGVDVGGELLWYCVCAWNERFGGSVLDYGCYPPQARSVFAAADARPGLSQAFPDMTDAQRVYAGLGALLPELLGREWPTADGSALRCERGLIDSGWEGDAVRQAIAASPHAGGLWASKGVGRSATQWGVAKWKPRPGERSGHHWRLTVGERGRGRQVQFDPDAWKSFLCSALTVPLGGPTGLSLWGKPEKAAQHELFAEHCAAEYSEPMTLRGDTFDKWLVRPHRTDNHLWDTLVLAAVAASVQGLTWQADGSEAPRPKPKKRLDIEAMYAAARAAEGAV